METRFYLEQTPTLKEAIELAGGSIADPLPRLFIASCMVRYDPRQRAYYYSVDEQCDGLPHFMQGRPYRQICIQDDELFLECSAATLEATNRDYHACLMERKAALSTSTRQLLPSGG